MILIKGNVEKIVENEEAAAKLTAKGFRLLRAEVRKAPDVAVPVNTGTTFKTGTAGFREDPPDKNPLGEMPVSKLRTLARAKGFSGVNAMTKAELVVLLEE